VVEKESEEPMPRTHKPYDASFRQQAVELWSTSGKTQRPVARDLGISVETLRDWKRKQDPQPVLQPTERAGVPGDLARAHTGARLLPSPRRLALAATVKVIILEKTFRRSIQHGNSNSLPR